MNNARQDFQYAMRLTNRHMANGRRMEDAFARRDEIQQAEIAPLLAYLAERGRKQDQLYGYLTTYEHVCQEYGGLEGLEPGNAAKLVERWGGLSKSRRDRICDLKAAQVRLGPEAAKWPLPAKRGEADALLAELRKQYFGGITTREGPGAKGVILTERDVALLVLGVPALRVGPYHHALLLFAIKLLEANGGRLPGLATARLRDLLFGPGGRPWLITIVDEGSPNKRRMNWCLVGLQPWLEAAMQAHPDRRGDETLQEFASRCPDSLILLEPGTQRIPLQDNTLVRWLSRIAHDKLGLKCTRKLGPNAFRHFTYSRRSSEGWSLAMMRMAAGHVKDSESAHSYIDTIKEALHRERRRVGWNHGTDEVTCPQCPRILEPGERCPEHGLRPELPGLDGSAASAAERLARAAREARPA